MKNLNFLTTKILLIATVVFFSCSKDKDGPSENKIEDADRTVMLTSLADEIVIPSYTNFKIKLDGMVAQSNTFTAAPTLESLQKLRQSWSETYIEWQKVELFDFGPANDQILHSFFNNYPARVTIASGYPGILENIADGSANLNLPQTYPTQGFPALDYLLNGLGNSDEEILQHYTSAEDAAKKVAYLKKVIDQMSSKFTKVYSPWTSNYRDEFISKSSMGTNSSTSNFVNAFILNYERYIRSGKFGYTSGAMGNGNPVPENVEAYYKKDLSQILAKTAHQASVDFFNGKSVKTGIEGPSLKTYLIAIGAKDLKTGRLLTDTLNGQFAAINKNIAALKPNLAEEVQTNNQAMIDTYNKLQTATRMLKVDMTSAMSVTITYTDNDGD